MHSRTKSAILTVIFAASMGAGALAYMPTVADLDATARAVGNRRDVAQRIGVAIFSTRWSAQVSQISANQLDDHLIVGIRVWGVKFHHPLTRTQFVDEIVTLVARAFSTAPRAEEVDVWTSVPIAVGKGVVVSGDLAKPTSRTVFSLTARRGESAALLRDRINDGQNVFWDPRWSGSVFKEPS